MISKIFYRFALRSILLSFHNSLRFQCAIPVFDGLLPEPHNCVVLDLLFVMAHWHGLAKLRMHHELTLEVMESVTVSLGKLLRLFSSSTCLAFETKELRREADARVRRESKKAAASHRQTGSSQVESADPTVPLASEEYQSAGQPPPAEAAGRRPKSFNLSTYKVHSLGDYVKTIRQYGTADSYSTELVHYPFFLSCLRLIHSLG
jgi:hypothetical protein